MLKCKSCKYGIFLAVFFILTQYMMVTEIMASDREYTIMEREDGGYTLNLFISKRHWKPITAEGFFPKEEKSYTIDIVGPGKDWSFRAQNGFYYSLEQIVSTKRHWDIGYAWVDPDKRYLYLNLYWVSSPDGLSPSDVSGKYRLDNLASWDR